MILFGVFLWALFYGHPFVALLVFMSSFELSSNNKD